MGRLSEHSEGEDDHGSPAHLDTSVTSKSEDKDEGHQEEAFTLAEYESLQIRRSKTMLVVVILALAVAMGCLTHYVVREQEDERYHTRVRRAICGLRI